MTELEALYLEALRVYAPERLPETYREIVGLPVKCAFGLNFRIRNRWNDFSVEQRMILTTYLQRPSTLPESYVSPSGRFRVHYATIGYDAVSAEDLDGSGIPDYVEETGRSLDYVYSVEVEQLGFKPPPDDENHDGPEWDVYIIDMPHGYGSTNTDALLSRNPDVYSSYMFVDNNYTHTQTKGLDGLRVTLAHEFFHMIQMGYNGRENNFGGFADLFLMEAGSSWMEDVCYDDVNDYYFWLTSVFNATNIAFDYDEYWHGVGLCVWFHFLEKRTGSREFARKIWEQIVNYPAVEATDMALREMGRTFEDELPVFYGWNYLTGSRADASRFYPEGLEYPEMKLDGAFVFEHDTTVSRSVRHLACRYFQFQYDDASTFTLIPTNMHRNSDAPEGAFFLVIAHDDHNPLNTDLENGVQTRLISDTFLQWRCVAVVEFPDGQTLFIPFIGSPGPDIDESLPASYPNPFVLGQHSMTTIPFILEKPGVVKILIMHPSGYGIENMERYYASSGLQFYQWNGLDRDGREVPGGIYLYIIIVDRKLLRKEKIAVVR
ncbi:MAG: MXAN_6640 family putative metalloprotease [bacterium]